MSLEELMILPDIFNVSNINELNETLRNGSNINVKNYYDETPLLWAVRENKNVALIEEFLKLGAEVNTQDCWGITPLYSAVTKRSENLKLINLLLESGANIKGGKPFNDRGLEQVFIHRRPCAELLIKYKFLKNHCFVKQPVLNENSQTTRNYYLDYKEVVDLNINQSCYNAYAGYLDICASEVLHMQSVRLCNKQSMLDFVSGKISSECLHAGVLRMQYVQLCSEQSLLKFIPGKASLECFQTEVAQQVIHEIFEELNSFNYVVYKSMIASKLGREYLLSKIDQLLFQMNVRASLSQCIDKTYLNSDSMFLIAKYLSDEDLLNFAIAHLKTSKN